MAPREPLSARTLGYQLLGAAILIAGFAVIEPGSQPPLSLSSREFADNTISPQPGQEPESIAELDLDFDAIGRFAASGAPTNSENVVGTVPATSETTGVERVVPPLEGPAPPPGDPELPLGGVSAETPAACCSAGQPRVRAYTTPAFDQFTRQLDAGTATELKAIYSGGAVVFSPYWDDKLTDFEDATAYIDLYAIYPSALSANDDVVLRDASGRRLFIPWGCVDGTCPQYAGDVGDPVFRDRLSERVGRLVDAGYRRILLDDVNMHMAVSNGNGVAVAPFDPRTGLEMTIADWRRYVAETVEQMAADHPGVAFEHNGVWFVDSPAFTDPFIDRQIAVADVVHLERGASDAGLTGGTGQFSLENLMRFVERAHALGTNVFYYHQAPDNPAAHELNLAVYLLTNAGNDIVGSNDVTHIGPETYWSGYRSDLGEALTPRTSENGLHERHFSDGVVYVLEPDAAARTVELDRPMFDVDGDLVTSIVLAPASGRVLTDTCDTGCS